MLMEQPDLRRIGIGATSEGALQRVSRTLEVAQLFFDKHRDQPLALPNRRSIVECSPEELGNKEFYQYFAGFLLTLTFMKKNDATQAMEATFYSCGQLLDWFNCLVQLCRERYAPREAIFQNYILPSSESNLLFTKIRRDLEKNIYSRLIQSGESLQNKATPFARQQVYGMALALRNINSVTSYEALGMA